MDKKTIEALGLSQEKLTNLVVDHIAHEYSNLENIDSVFRQEMNSRINNYFKKQVQNLIDKTISEQIEKLMDKKISPVDIWGDPTGEPTTIKSALHERAMKYWDTNVDTEGRLINYGGKPRYQHMIEKALTQQFNKAMKENINTIVDAFKDAMKKDAIKHVENYVEKVFKSPNSRNYI